MPNPNARLYWWLLECNHYGTSELHNWEVEMPEIECLVCGQTRRGVRREAGFAQYGD